MSIRHLVAGVLAHMILVDLGLTKTVLLTHGLILALLVADKHMKICHHIRLSTSGKGLLKQFVATCTKWRKVACLSVADHRQNNLIAHCFLSHQNRLQMVLGIHHLSLVFCQFDHK